MPASRLLAALLAAVPAGACAPSSDSKPSGPCYVAISGTLAYLADGGVVSVPDTVVPDGGVTVAPGTMVNLTYYFESGLDFQYQVRLVEEAHGLVVRTLVPTTRVDVWPDDNSAYVWDVVPVDTTGLSGGYSVQLGAHLDVDLKEFTCTEPLDEANRVVVSNWRTIDLRVAAPASSSSSGPAPSSSAGPASSSGG